MKSVGRVGQLPIPGPEGRCRIGRGVSGMEIMLSV